MSRDPVVGVVVLTQGRRPTDLDRAVRSVLAQRGVAPDVVVVGNGWQPTGLPAGVGALGLPENVGIPAGRNAGVPSVTGDLLLFLDDDATLTEKGCGFAVVYRTAGRVVGTLDARSSPACGTSSTEPARLSR